MRLHTTSFAQCNDDDSAIHSIDNSVNIFSDVQYVLETILTMMTIMIIIIMILTMMVILMLCTLSTNDHTNIIYE